MFALIFRFSCSLFVVAEDARRRHPRPKQKGKPMASQRLFQVSTRLIRVVFVAVFVTLLATGSPVSATDSKAGGGGVTTMGCGGGCM